MGIVSTFLIVLSSLYVFVNLFMIIIRIFSNDIEPITYSNTEKLLLYLSVGIIITAIIV